MEKTTNISNEESSKKTFKQLCEEMGVNYVNARKTKSRHKLTNEETIIYYLLTFRSNW